MRRTILVFALALLSAAALSATALAKEGGVELGSTPAGIGPGDPWTPSLTLIDNRGELPANPEPGITITNLATGETIDYPATPTDNPAVFTVRVVFPTPGQWDYAAYDGVTDRRADEELAQLQLAAAAHEHGRRAVQVADELRVVGRGAGCGVDDADVAAGP